ncbi:MAG: hypothetical protein NTV32_05400 [Gammaproteobacteria bacterium]|nr:hypothetical protein [Gammaproteobacteria bacterium]
MQSYDLDSSDYSSDEALGDARVTRSVDSLKRSHTILKERYSRHFAKKIWDAIQASGYDTLHYASMESLEAMLQHHVNAPGPLPSPDEMESKINEFMIMRSTCFLLRLRYGSKFSNHIGELLNQHFQNADGFSLEKTESLKTMIRAFQENTTEPAILESQIKAFLSIPVYEPAASTTPLLLLSLGAAAAFSDLSLTHTGEM